MLMGESSIQVGGGGIANDDFGAIFYKGNSEGAGSGDAVFSSSNVVFNGIAFWELNEGTQGSGKNEINISNAQGAAQFIGSNVVLSNARFNLSSMGDAGPTNATAPEPISLVTWGGSAV